MTTVTRCRGCRAETPRAALDAAGFCTRQTCREVTAALARVAPPVLVRRAEREDGPSARIAGLRTSWEAAGITWDATAGDAAEAVARDGWGRAHSCGALRALYLRAGRS